MDHYRYNRTSPPWLRVMLLVPCTACIGTCVWLAWMGLADMEGYGPTHWRLILTVLLGASLLTVFLYAVFRRSVAAIVVYLWFALLSAGCGLNWLYPREAGAGLVREEARALNDTLGSYRARAHAALADAVPELAELHTLSREVTDWIAGTYTAGSRGHSLDAFNGIAGTHFFLTAEHFAGTATQRRETADTYGRMLERAIRRYSERQLGVSGAARPEAVLRAVEEIDTLAAAYGWRLADIIHGTAQAGPDPVRTQTATLEALASELDLAAEPLDGLRGHRFARLGRPEASRLYSFEHTLPCMGRRMDRADTWTALLIAFFLNIGIPAAIWCLIGLPAPRRRGEYY